MFADSGVEAIQRPLEQQPASLEEISDDMEDIASVVISGNYQRVALQFPDTLLRHSVPIYRALKSHLPSSIMLYVLADTAYGSCCVDEVAANHVDADVVIHFGHTCLSPTTRLPVIYSYPKLRIDVHHCVESLADIIRQVPQPKVVLLRYDVGYAHELKGIQSQLEVQLPQGTHLITSVLPRSATPQRPFQFQPIPATFRPEDCLVLYIGPESLALTNLLVTHAQSQIWSYDPSLRQFRLESPTANKLLMRRYVALQKARDADVFGILVGSLAVASYLPMISHLRTILNQAHKKTYTISVGKLNPAKLANFLEIECFILVACPENSIIDAKEFFRPIVTPFELELALDSHSIWTGHYELSLDNVLAKSFLRSAQDQPPPSTSYQDIDQPAFSLITGKYRKSQRFGAEDDADIQQGLGSTSLATRNQNTSLTKISSAQYLQNRTFRGLEQRLGQDEPATLEQGRVGIARGYGETKDTTN